MILFGQVEKDTANFGMDWIAVRQLSKKDDVLRR